MFQKTCIQCHSAYVSYSSRSRFCGSPCHRKWVGLTKRVEVECPNCLKSRTVRVRPKPGILCRDCLTGVNSPTWKGGHSNWSPGRYGRDKNGLSWKVQRDLAWERDAEVCQHCHTKKRRKPDVHHIVPWRTSQSHALDNLVCLCQSCHLKEEARAQEQWGGAHFYLPKKRTRPRCGGCDIPLQGSKPLCKKCEQARLSGVAQVLRAAGLDYKGIASEMGVSVMSAYYYVNGRKKS